MKKIEAEQKIAEYMEIPVSDVAVDFEYGCMTVHALDRLEMRWYEVLKANWKHFGSSFEGIINYWFTVAN